MPFSSQHIGRMLRWVVRFRHRRGYGIHSPFAFGLVTGVVYERGRYYAYDALSEIYKAAPHRYGLRWKDCQLLFRLANFQHPATCLLLGFKADSLPADMVRAACPHCHVRLGNQTLSNSNNPSADLTNGSRTFPGSDDNTPLADLIITADGWESTPSAQLLSALREGGMLIVQHTGSRCQRQAWQALTEQPQAQVCFDLHDFGIVCFRPELQRQQYVINYF